MNKSTTTALATAAIAALALTTLTGPAPAHAGGGEAPCSATINITKTGPGGEALAGAEFVLTSTGGFVTDGRDPGTVAMSDFSRARSAEIARQQAPWVDGPQRAAWVALRAGWTQPVMLSTHEAINPVTAEGLRGLAQAMLDETAHMDPLYEGVLGLTPAIDNAPQVTASRTALTTARDAATAFIASGAVEDWNAFVGLNNSLTAPPGFTSEYPVLVAPVDDAAADAAAWAVVPVKEVTLTTGEDGTATTGVLWKRDARGGCTASDVTITETAAPVGYTIASAPIGWVFEGRVLSATVMNEPVKPTPEPTPTPTSTPEPTPEPEPEVPASPQPVPPAPQPVINAGR